MSINEKISDMSIEKKLYAGFGLVALLLIIVGYVGVGALNMAESDIEHIAATDTMLLEDAADMEIAMLQARRN